MSERQAQVQQAQNEVLLELGQALTADRAVLQELLISGDRGPRAAGAVGPIHVPKMGEADDAEAFLETRTRDTGSAERSRQQKAESLATPFVFLTYAKITAVCLTSKNKSLNSKALKTCSTHLCLYLIVISQRQGKKTSLYKAWVIYNKEKYIHTANCTCMAGRSSQTQGCKHFTPCLNHLTLKEKLTVNSQKSRGPHDVRSSQLTRVPEDDSLGSKIFQRTVDDNKVASSIEDKLLIELIDKEMFINKGNSWIAPLPFCTSRSRLPNNREQALNRFNSLCRTLDRKAEMKQHFVAFMQRIFDQDHAELAPPLAEGEECWYLPTFGVYHPRKPGQIRAIFDSSAKHLGVSL
ncbi:hypothetical protein N1851_024461 [Merluccius polli]|uniref:SWIM-type domain-containing protein n=1 Tax=Merluccius polli TaxID=89951 RepID=A0AA47MEW6_MERPO|nr:hypothetical protein N1851_024461 [Merluccius polli]